MITIVLSEQDFDYEIQALVRSFFPGVQSRFQIESGMTLPDSIDSGTVRQPGDSYGMDSEDAVFWIWLCLGRHRIDAAVRYDLSPVRCGFAEAPGTEDWHKREGKKTHPYRAYYKNELKKLLFSLLRDYPEEYLPSTMKRRIPDWGTMTGVRPVKIPMNRLQSGVSARQVLRELRETYLCSPQKAELGVQIAVREAALLERLGSEPGYSLYVGIPFCPTTCLYCSFPSYPLERFGTLTKAYLEALKQELAASAEFVKGRPLSSIYIGGGTPTALTAEQLQELLTCIQSYYPVREALEYTVEAGRPDSISREKLEVLRQMGVSRISVNPQTMQQKTLDLIGRRHTVDDTVQAFRLAREAGFSNINMDLIIGLPGEEVSDFQDTLRRIRELNPDSVTMHSLVIKRASRLRTVLEEQAATQRMTPEELEGRRGGQMEQMLARGQQFAIEQGYLPYYMYRQKNSAGHAGSAGQENIGYARPGCECLYNVLIMEEVQTILAVGAGASTKRYLPDTRQVKRVENVKSLTDYIARTVEMIERKRREL